MPIDWVWTSSLLCIFVGIPVINRMGGFPSKNHFPVDGRTVLITGGSQGLGKSAACILARRGANIIIIARNIEKLQNAVKEISECAIQPSRQRFHHISADLTNPSEAARVIDEATTWNDNRPPPIIWCCAGVSIPGLFVDTPLSTLHDQMNTNYFSAANVAHAALRAWLRPPQNRPYIPNQPAHHIIFTASVLAFYPIAGYGPYSPAKAALRALGDTLSQELQLYPSPPHPVVKPHVLFPATIFSPSLAAENAAKPAVTRKLEEDDGGQTPDQAAASCIRGLEQGREIVTTGWLGWAMAAGMLGSSKRAGWGVVDAMVGAVVGVVMPLVRRDMDGTVRRWGREHGVEGDAKG